MVKIKNEFVYVPCPIGSLALLKDCGIVEVFSVNQQLREVLCEIDHPTKPDKTDYVEKSVHVNQLRELNLRKDLLIDEFEFFMKKVLK